MILSNSELKEKLGASQDAQVIKWLNERHIKWCRDAQKKPITTLSAIEQYLLKETAQQVDF